MSDEDVAAYNALGVIGGDNSGFPNGRRLGDDVVDIYLQVGMGVLCHLGFCPEEPPIDLATLQLLNDGAIVDDCMFQNNFPYLNAPVPGNLVLNPNENVDSQFEEFCTP